MSLTPLGREKIELWRPPTETQQANNCTAHALAVVCECYEHTYLRAPHRDVSVGWLYGVRSTSKSGRDIDAAAKDMVDFGYVYRDEFEFLGENPECFEAVRRAAPSLSPQRAFCDWRELESNDEIWEYMAAYRLPVLLAVRGGSHAVALTGAERSAYRRSWLYNGKSCAQVYYDYRFVCLDSSVGLRGEDGLVAVSRWERACAVIPALPLPEGADGGPQTGGMDDLIFKDVKRDDWFFDAVGRVSDAGLMTGDGDGNFRPDDSLTRAEAAVIIGRLMKGEAKWS